MTPLGAFIESRQASTLVDDAPRARRGRMARGHRRKCKCCRKSFRPDPRNLRHQRYCSEPSCRAARKSLKPSPLARPEPRLLARARAPGIRSRAWRARHPGYWRKSPRPRTRMILLRNLRVQYRARPSAPQLPASLPTCARLSKGRSSPCVRMAAVPLRAFDNAPRATELRFSFCRPVGAVGRHLASPRPRA
jgi:hypothetical protein